MSIAATPTRARGRADARTSAPTAAPDAPPASFQQIDVDLIVASSTNFRKVFKQEALEELALSIRDKGVVEPVIVRPVAADKFTVEPGKQSGRPGFFVVDWRTKNHHSFHATEREAGKAVPRFELIAGERRLRASKLAASMEPPRPDLKLIPALVREYTDAAALEVQVIENDQREDISPMERAAGFKMMQDVLGYSTDVIAAKVNKSKTFVYSHLKLANLPPAAVEALEKGPEAGGITRSVAELIARIPDEKARERAAQEIVQGAGDSGPLTYREARGYVERLYMKELKGVPFALDDAELLPAAGPCTTCPHLSANTPEQYQGKRTDMCLLPSCLAEKLEAHRTSALNEYRDAGHNVLPLAEAAELFKYGDYIYGNSKYVKLADTHWGQHGNGQTYRQILGKDYKAVIALTPQGNIHELALKNDVKRKLDEAAPKPAGAGRVISPAAGSSSAASSPPASKSQLSMFLPPLTPPSADERAETLALKRLLQKAGGVQAVSVELMRFVVSDALNITSSADEIVEWRGIECEVGRSEQALRAFIAKATMPELVSLLVDIHYREASDYRVPPSDGQKQLLKIFGVNFDAAKRDAEKELEAWKRKLKTATATDRVVVEVSPARLKEGGRHPRVRLLREDR